MTSIDPDRRYIAEVLARVDLAQILDEIAGPAPGHGSRRRWHCPVPDHTDTNPSVTMFTDHRHHARWRCWSGDQHHRGDAIDLLVVSRNCTPAEALAYLAARVDITSPPVADPTADATSDRRDVSRALGDYVTAAERLLHTPRGAPVLDWLHGRGFSDEVIAANRLGADPGRLVMHRAAGLPSGRRVAATFPVFDAAGQLVYVQARPLDPGDGPKYENPAGRLLRHPHLGWTRPNPTVTPPVAGVLVVGEGLPDALTAADAGLPAVAFLGAGLAHPDTIGQLSTAAHDEDLVVVVIPDNDDAGHHWATRLHHHLAEHQVPHRVLRPPRGIADLNDWRLHSPAWADGLRRAVDTLHHDLAQPERSRGLELELG